MKSIQYALLLAALFITGNADGQLWKEYADSAKVYTDKKIVGKAIEFYSKAKEELGKDSLGTANYAKVCHLLGVLFYGKRQYKEAEALYLEAKQIREKVLGKESLDYVTTSDYLAFLYEDLGQYEKAEMLYLEVKQLRQKLLGKSHTHYANACNNLALLYRAMGFYEKAEPLYIESKQIHEKLVGKEHSDYADACNNLAILYRYMGQYEKAEPLCLVTKKIRENINGKQHLVYANACHNLATLYRAMGQYEKAEPLYLESNQIRGKNLEKEHPDNAKSYNNLANLYSDMGQYEKAESLLLEARRIYEKVVGKEHSDYASSCNNLAALYKSIGQYEKAETLLLEDNKIQEKVSGKNHPAYAISCNNLGVLYNYLGQYEKAELFFTEAKQIRERTVGKGHPDYAASCKGLANNYNDKGEYEKAEPLYLESMQVLEKAIGKEHPDYAGVCNNLAILYKHRKQYEKAELLYLQAKKIREKVFGKLHPDYGLSCSDLGNLYWLSDQPLRAEEEFKESFLANINNVFSVFQFTNEKEKAAYIKNILGEDNKAYSFYLSQKLTAEQPYSLSLFHRNLILSYSQALKKQMAASNDTALSAKYIEWISLVKYLSILYSLPVDKRKENVTKIEEKAGLLEKELTRLSSAFGNQEKKQRIKWQDIHQNLKTGEAAIEFAEFQYYNGKRLTDSIYYIALILRKDKPEPQLVQLFEKRQLESVFNYKSTSPGQHQLSYLYSKRQDEVLKSLYDIIWKPITQKLTGIKTVYFAPAGSLHKIAFAALPVNSNEVLSDKYQLIQLNTTASVGDNSLMGISASDKIILYGGVQYDADSTSIRQAALQYSANDMATRSLPDDLLRDGISDFNYLSGSEKEVNEIGKLGAQHKYNATVSVGIAASEESFKTLTGKNSPVILHIATHGFFFPDPKNEKKDDKLGGAIVFKQSDNPLIRSGLALSGANNAWKGKSIKGVEDGILTSYEVSNMYLPNTKLAVLSACETGLGDIQGSEGVYGLQRAFKMAGVENLIMSLWKVDDAATSEFMQEFYKNLFTKQTISTAFYNAQTIMKNKYRNDPYRWAAWVLIR